MFAARISIFRFAQHTFLSWMICVLATAAIADDTDPPTITVSGIAEVLVVPDYAVLRFSINSRALELAAAVSDNDAKVDAVIKFLTENKVESKLIRTELLRIQPIFESQSKQSYAQQSAVAPNRSTPGVTAEQRIKPIGYSARRQISVTINDLASFETIYRGLIERGVNEVDNLQFYSSELRKHRDEARLQAVRAAREKANAMASELGCSLAAVQSITESSSPGWRASNFQNSMTVAPGESSGSVASGMITISATVGVVFVLGEVELNE